MVLLRVLNVILNMRILRTLMEFTAFCTCVIPVNLKLMNSRRHQTWLSEGQEQFASTKSARYFILRE